MPSPWVRQLFIVADGGVHNLDVAHNMASRFSQRAVLNSEGLGPSGARNLALSYVKAPWVCFLDADDYYAPGYLEALAHLIEDSPESLELIHTNIKRVSQGVVLDQHPLRYRFRSTKTVVHLAEHPEMIGTSVAAACFDSRIIQQYHLRFNEVLKWSEDADFIVRFLLKSSQQVGFARHTEYLYRVDDASSISSNAWSDPAKYIEPFTQLYLP